MTSKIINNQYYPYFDYLRFVLASFVMFGHDHIFRNYFNLWHGSGNFCVQVFFALSGFLIGSILLKTPITDIPRFYFNRAVRIWVPYFIGMLLLLFASTLHDQLSLKWFEIVFYMFTFVYDIFGTSQLETARALMPLQGTGNHFWSVNTEEQFYLLAPLLLVLVNKKIGHSILLWLLIASAGLILNIFSSILLGVLAAVVLFHYPNFIEKHLTQLFFFVTLIIGIIGLCVGSYYNFYASLTAISIVLLLAKTGQQTTIGTYIGGVSYPLYLNHWIGVIVGNAALKPFGLKDSSVRFFLAVLISYSIALVMYHYIEKPLLEARSKVFTKQRGIQLAIIAYTSVIIGLIVGLQLQ